MLKFTLALGAAALGVTAMAEPALAQANEQFLPALVYRTGPYAPNGIPFANGVADYWTLLNERDGGINGVKIAVGGMRDRLRHRQGRRMLRAPEGQGPDRRRLLLAAVDRHHLRADREGARRQDPAADDGLRPLGEPERRGVPLELHRRRHATGPRPTSPSSTSPRSSAASTSSRARRSASSITTAPMARSRSRRSKRAPR